MLYNIVIPPSCVLNWKIRAPNPGKALAKTGLPLDDGLADYTSGGLVWRNVKPWHMCLQAHPRPRFVHPVLLDKGGESYWSMCQLEIDEYLERLSL